MNEDMNVTDVTTTTDDDDTTVDEVSLPEVKDSDITISLPAMLKSKVLVKSCGITYPVWFDTTGVTREQVATMLLQALCRKASNLVRITKGEPAAITSKKLSQLATWDNQITTFTHVMFKMKDFCTITRTKVALSEAQELFEKKVGGLLTNKQVQVVYNTFPEASKKEFKTYVERATTEIQW
jgi:hypothetical protein